MIINEYNDFKGSQQVLDFILDKINRVGKSKLTPDERTFLEQYNKGIYNKELGEWILEDHGELLFDEITYDEDDVFYDEKRLIRSIEKIIDKKLTYDYKDGFAVGPYTKSDDYYLVVDTESMVVALIDIDDKENEIMSAQTGKEFYKLIREFKK